MDLLKTAASFVKFLKCAAFLKACLEWSKLPFITEISATKYFQE